MTLQSPTATLIPLFSSSELTGCGYSGLHYDVNSKDFFTLDNERSHDTRGHSKKLVKHRTLSSLRQKSFCYRVIDQWNSLPEDIVNAKTVISFKTLLDKHLIQHHFDISEIY